MKIKITPSAKSRYCFVRLTEEQRKKLEDMAKKNKVTVSEVIRQIIEQTIK